ncbi:ABC transporter ATP-binding protein [Spirulina sp. CCNP1310]|uniref:ABC transporter ATP-binding protein n=1 Tax=Spirulina sp. CCNP1310 TaxID=3110249 RepID=UPI002B20671C|nr:ABC transporter ATP-binding protein [Spirulina sp. CCNP1310]MEA5419387.1 ABC transporter ATP-binding protein [Spirulina sp. CCNP1310]
MTSSPVHPLQRLLHYGRRYRLAIGQATTCSILNKLFDLAPPVLIGAAVDVVVKQQDSLIAGWGVRDPGAQLVLLSVLSAVIWGLESLFEYGYDRLWRNLAQRMQHDLRLEAYDHVQNLEMRFFEDRSTGGLLAILNDDINQLERFLDIGANEILQVTTTVIVVSGGFFLLAPEVAWLTMIPIPIIIWGSIAFQNRLAPRYAAVREKVSLLSTRLANNLSGIATIKSFTTEAYELDRLRQDSAAYGHSNRHAIALSAAFVPLIRFVIFGGFIATLLLGGQEAIAGRLAVGTYSTLVFMTQRLLWPLTRLGQTLDQYQRAMASTQRVMNLLDTPIRIALGGRVLPQVQGAIAFSQVQFSYQPGYPILRGLSLTIPAGQTIGIAGATGSGKSTLVKLLLRFYEIEGGSITIDGLDIRDIQLGDLRRAMGLVSQDVFLFHGTVAENIAYGSPGASVAEIGNAAKLAEAEDFIAQLPQGYETIVGERGQKLSGGQRQRLAIARAILKNPPILILDEATSAVDNETEAAISRALAHITENRTTIAIAHRLSTIRHADRIYVMDQGHIAEAGDHDTLLAQGGIYANLWRVQTGE